MRASDRAYEALRGDILAWRLRPGTPLSEIELAERLGVSRTPLRAALARLAVEGFVDTTRGRTAIVSDVSEHSVRGYFELREALETHAARLAARRRDGAVFADLAERFDRATALLDAGDIDSYYALIAEFDQALAVAIENPAFAASLDAVRAHLARARRMAADNAERLRRSASEHRLICEAIRDGDEALAASAVSAHLRHALTTILATLAVRDRQETPA